MDFPEIITHTLGQLVNLHSKHAFQKEQISLFYNYKMGSVKAPVLWSIFIIRHWLYTPSNFKIKCDITFGRTCISDEIL